MSTGIEHGLEPIEGDAIQSFDRQSEKFQTRGERTALAKAGKFTSMRADVQWIYDNLDRCVNALNMGSKKGHVIEVNFFRADREPPSPGAIGLMKVIAAGGPTAKRKFYEQYVSYLPKESTYDAEAEERVPEEIVKEEERDLLKLRKFLEGFTRDFQRKQKEAVS